MFTWPRCGYGLQVHPAGAFRRDARRVAPGPAPGRTLGARAKCTGNAGVRLFDGYRGVAFEQVISALDWW